MRLLMFANFKISPAGLRAAQPTKKHSRTVSGCLTCRRKKKKCSEEKPVCRRCRRNLSTEPCVWDSSESSRSKEPTRRSETPSASSEVVISSEKSLKDGNLSPASMGCGTSLDVVPRGPMSPLAQIEGFDLMKFLLKTFSDTSSLSYIKPDVALLTHSMPCAFDSPPLMHAYAACGAALLSKPGYEWERVAVNHYNKAVNAVRDALRNYKHYDRDEWLLATVNALHIFETIRQDVKSPNRLHLDGAKRLYQMSLKNQKPQNRFHKVLLEEYIFQFAIASTFTPIQDADGTRYEDLQGLLQALVGNCQETNFWKDWRESSLLGVSHDFFNYIFKLSYLRRKVPLQGGDLIEAIIILTKLQAWRPLTMAVSNGFDDFEMSAPPWEMIVMARLYHATSLIYVSKIIDPSLSTDDPVVREMVGRGQRILQEVPDHKWQQASVLIWPLLMLGISAVSFEERQCFYRPLKFLLSVTNLGCVRTVLTLLRNSWTTYPSGDIERCLGLDVLFRDDLLCEVTF